MDVLTLSRRRKFIAVTACVAGLLCGACDQTPDAQAREDVRERLVGTWLRDYEEGGVHVRRVLMLGVDGRFQETFRAGGDGPDTQLTQHTHSGEWLYDGTNLKRRYTSIDGQQPSAPVIPFLTLELQFDSRNEFKGLDRVRHVEVAYRRVEDGTSP